MESDLNAYLTMEADLEDIDAEGMLLAYQELAKTVKPGEEKQTEIRVKDYIDYYPLTIWFDFPKLKGHVSTDRLNKEDDQKVNTEEYFAFRMKEFFKIPVLENEYYQISLGKNELGGYGIYCLPINEQGMPDADKLSMVYELNPEIDVVFLHMNPEKTKLLLHTVEEKNYVLTVIDVQTFETVQKLTVKENRTHNTQLYDEGNYIFLPIYPYEQGNSEILVISVNEMGEYERILSVPLHPEKVPYFNTAELALAFDGEKLAVAGVLDNADEWYRSTCNVFVAVYDQTGMHYYGEYKNSLDSGVSEDNYSFHCLSDGLEPITLSWSE